MKKDTHSKDYRLVVFEDSSCNYSFLTRSTVKTDKTVKWEDGNEYPLFKLDISDKSCGINLRTHTILKKV